MKFTPEDFIELCNTDPRSANEYASELANAKLEEWLKDAPVVEAFLSQYHKLELWSDYPNLKGHKKAKLVCIEEISRTYVARMKFTPEDVEDIK